ncbi:MAG: DEAD/DEAH box helicase, partial [Christensenellales bacterium]
ASSFAIDNLFQEGNSLIVAGTGAGKTIMLSETIRRFVNAFKSKFDRFPHTLVLVHRTEIHNQNLTKFQWVAPSIPTSEIIADRKSVHGLVHFGMVQTVTNVIDKLPAFDLIVIDEAHHSMASTYLNIINKNKEKAEQDTYILGVSATPNRGDKLPLNELFNNFYQITTKFLIDSHYLVRPKFIDLTPRFGAEIGHLAKNVNWDSLDGIQLLNKLIDDYLEYKESGKTIIFAPSHKICKLIRDNLISRGRTPAYLGNGISDEERFAELEKFEKGNAEELINVDIATEGYDYPELRNVIDFDTNGNETQWIQKVGRGLRIAPGKTGCTVIDFGGNLQLYPDVEVEVNLEGEFKAPKGKRLSGEDFYIKKTEKPKEQAIFADKKEFTPYSLPEGWESLNDEELGIVYTISGSTRDALVVKCHDNFSLFMTDKTSLRKSLTDTLHNCLSLGDKYVKETSSEVWKDQRLINKMQIKKLSPKYPTMTLTWHSANCIICWECWRKGIKNEIQS